MFINELKRNGEVKARNEEILRNVKMMAADGKFRFIKGERDKNLDTSVQIMFVSLFHGATVSL